jgi:hypothetical protein
VVARAISKRNKDINIALCLYQARGPGRTSNSNFNGEPTMPSFVRLLCLGLYLGCSLPAFAIEDTPQNRAQQAARYLQAAPPEGIVEDMARRIAAGLPQDKRQPFIAAMEKDANAAAIKDAAQAALVKVFTADELKGLADFYSSPVTKSAMSKMGTYMHDAMPAIMKEVEAAAQKAEKETGVLTESQQEGQEKKPAQ